MKKHQIKIGGIYEAKISGELVAVRISFASVDGGGGWYGLSFKSRRTIHIKSAQRLRRPIRFSEWTRDGMAAIARAERMGWTEAARDSIGVTRGDLSAVSRLRDPTLAEALATEQAIGHPPENSPGPEESSVSDQEAFDELLGNAGPAIIRMGKLIRKAGPPERQSLNEILSQLTPEQTDAMRELMTLAELLAIAETRARKSTSSSLAS